MLFGLYIRVFAARLDFAEGISDNGRLRRERGVACRTNFAQWV